VRSGLRGNHAAAVGLIYIFADLSRLLPGGGIPGGQESGRSWWFVIGTTSLAEGMWFGMSLSICGYCAWWGDWIGEVWGCELGKGLGYCSIEQK
jgi:hypothetical protein